MQNTATFRTVTRGAVQLVVLAAVAAVGVSVGRWVIPADGSASASAVSHINSDVSAGQNIMERKLAQMDAQDSLGSTAVAGFVTAPSVPGAGSIVERKLAQMDAQDAPHGPAVAPAASAPSVLHGASIIERKLAQMDALDSRSAAVSGNGSIVDRKFAQMDAEDGR